MNQSSNSSNRVEGIDVLRGLCILAVVLHHIGLRIAVQNIAWRPAHTSALMKVLIWSGYYGVRVFFVISGFLITTWSLKRWRTLAEISLRKFYVMRFARIVPCLVALLILLSMLHLARIDGFIINPQRSTLPRALLAALTFHVNWLEGHHGYLPGAWDVLWSLSVEEVFYVFFPLLCSWTRKQWILIAMLAGFVVAGPFARVLTHSNIWSEYGYLQSMDGIALGCLAGMLSNKISISVRTALYWIVVGTALCAFILVFRETAARTGFYKLGLDVVLLNIGAALLVIAFQQRIEKGINPARWWSFFVRWSGRNSYEMYLTHMLVVWPAMRLFSRIGAPMKTISLWFLGIAALTAALAYLVARFYSEPLNRYLRSTLSVSAQAARA